MYLFEPRITIQWFFSDHIIGRENRFVGVTYVVYKDQWMQILEEIMKFCGGGGGRRGNVSSAPPKQPQINTDDIFLLSVGTLSFSMSCCLYDHRALENPVSITGEEKCSIIWDATASSCWRTRAAEEHSLVSMLAIYNLIQYVLILICLLITKRRISISIGRMILYFKIVFS